MGVNVLGLAAIIIFYVVIAFAGVWAARATRKRKSTTETETIIVGGRDFGIFLGFCTLTASWIGGGAINGTAEAVYDPKLGAIWTLGPFASGIGLVLNGLFFTKKMREGGYVTILDPYQAKLGKHFAPVFFALELFAGVLYVAAILTAIGGTLEVVAGLPRVASVVVSAAISAFYTVLGGLYSVAYTDVIQLSFMTFALVLAAPFALNHEAVTSISETYYGDGGWIGTLDSDSIGSYVDTWLLVLLGGIPLQNLYQRIFSADSTKHAKVLCITAGIFSPLLVLPPLLMGAAGASTNWTMTLYMNGSGISPADLGEERMILPIVLQYLTPPVVAFFGLGAVSAAVMSSMDSVFLAVASLFGKNIYKSTIRPKASESEIVWVIRISIVLVAVAATAISLVANSVTGLYYMCLDFMYVLTWPHFVSLLYFDPNAYGAIPALIIGFVLRIGGGEFLLNWSPPFAYAGGSNFPFKTVAMLSTLATLNVISYLARYLFGKGYIPEKYDILKSNLSHGGRTRFTKRWKHEARKDLSNRDEDESRMLSQV